MRSAAAGILFILLSFSATAQGGWQWGKKLTTTTPSLSCTDSYGNITGTIPYQTSITIGDTGFSHWYYTPPTANCAMFDWDRKGRMIRLTDFHTVENKSISWFRSVSDDRQNLYMTCQFTVRMFTGDTMINHGPVPRIMDPDILIAKLSPGRQPRWMRTVSGFGSDIFYGLSLSDSGLMLATYHNSSLLPNRVLLLGRDTLSPDPSTMLFTLADTNGNPVKYSSLRFLNNSVSNILFTSAQDGRSWLTGNAYSGIISGEDTIFSPSYPEPCYNPFLISLSGGGSVTHIGYLPLGLQPQQMVVTRSGYRCYSSAVSWTFSIGNDTITLPWDTLASLIFCTDSLNVLKWSYLLKYHYSQVYPPEFRITGLEDSIVFTTQCSGDFDFAGTTFHAGDSSRLLTGVLDPAGNLRWHLLSDPVKGIQPSGILADRCGNIILSGMVQGTFVFGPDTLFNSTGASFGFLARIERHPSPASGIKDTVMFFQDTLNLNVSFPYEKIRWSTGDTGQYFTIIGAQLQPGFNTFWVEMKDGFCIATDTFRVNMMYHYGISEKGTRNIRIYPNPSHDMICIVADNPDEPAEIAITNVFGEVVNRFVQRTPTVTLNISDWAPGIYLFRIKTRMESTVIKFIRN